MKTKHPISAGLLLALWLWSYAVLGMPLVLGQSPQDLALGCSTEYLKEDHTPLTLSEANAARMAGRFSPTPAAIPVFGIGSHPVWLHLSVSNPGNSPVSRRLLLENPWLDSLEVHFVHAGTTVTRHQLGDAQPYAERPVSSRYLAVDHAFAPGTTDLWLRLSSPDPLLAPLYLLDASSASRREILQGYSYGFLYGYLFALFAYNLVLYFSLRDRRHLLYAAFIGVFAATNIAYTGHGYAWLWPQSVELQRWIIPLLMMAYPSCGLAFARCFLDTKQNLPRAHKVIVRVERVALCLLPFTLIFAGNQLYLLLLAFSYVTFFSFVMPILGGLALWARLPASRYFLFATLASMLGTMLTALSVWGFIPYNIWTFRAAEVGMLIDATLLALALGYRFRIIQSERQQAEERAAHDSLTGLYNRRAFIELAEKSWNHARRHGHELSLIMLDLDHFKSVNDRYGHATGDAALIATAGVMLHTLRQADIVARWGGEEFLIMLPETGIEAAQHLAERLRMAIEALRLGTEEQLPALTASLGVASSNGHDSLDKLISEADKLLYASKQGGRNRISIPRPSTA